MSWPVPIPSTLRRKGCDLFVPLTSRTAEERREAALWALKQFDDKSIDLWVLGPNQEPGFWFKNDRDALLFTLKWS
jgi:hypothetical protein